LLLLVPILLSSGLYYYAYSGSNLNNLLEDISQSSSAKFTYFFDRFRFTVPPDSSSSSNNNNFQDLSQFNIEIQTLRNEVQSIKSRYQELNTVKDGKQDGDLPPPSPPADGPN